MIERAPDITRLIDRLEKQGLAERDRSERDRRLSISRITAWSPVSASSTRTSRSGSRRATAASCRASARASTVSPRPPARMQAPRNRTAKACGNRPA
jgi:hypothetical protein